MRLRLTARALPLIPLAAVILSEPTDLAAQSGARRHEIPAAYAAIREADLRRAVGEMASRAMRGREGGTIDELRASMWVAEQYRRIGLKPAGEDGTYFQWFEMTRPRGSTSASRATIGGQPLTLVRDLIPLLVVPAEASGAVLWVPDAADTTVAVRGRLVATPLLAPAPSTIRANSYTFASRYADAAIAGTLAHFARRGAAAVLLVANAAVDSAFEVVASARSRGAYDVDRAVPRAANGSDRVAPPPALGTGPTPALRFVLDTVWDRPTHPEGWYFRSDHLPYARRNVPALMYTTNLHDDYHTPRDRPERIDYPKLTRMAQWMYLTGWFAANAPAVRARWRPPLPPTERPRSSP